MTTPWPRLVLTVLCCLLAGATAGCATASRQAWTKAGAAPEELARDRYACIRESRVPWGQSYGGAAATSGSAGASSGSGGSVAQGGSDGGFILRGVQRRAQSEANRLFDACMEARGWQ
jgi:hypothetical protein